MFKLMGKKIITILHSKGWMLISLSLFALSGKKTDKFTSLGTCKYVLQNC